MLPIDKANVCFYNQPVSNRQVNYLYDNKVAYDVKRIKAA